MPPPMHRASPLMQTPAASAAADGVPLSKEELLAHDESELFGRLRIPLYPFLALLISTFVLLEIPYAKPELPQPLMIAIGFFSAVVIIFLSLESVFFAILGLVAFIPFSNLLPGTFGRFLIAFNLTNIITIVICVGWFARGALHRLPML